MNFNFNKGQQHVTSLGQVPRILNREYYASLAPCFLRRARLIPLASDCSAMIVLPRAIVVGPTILLSAEDCGFMRKAGKHCTLRWLVP